MLARPRPSRQLRRTGARRADRARVPGRVGACRLPHDRVERRLADLGTTVRKHHGRCRAAGARAHSRLCCRCRCGARAGHHRHDRPARSADPVGWVVRRERRHGSASATIFAGARERPGSRPRAAMPRQRDLLRGGVAIGCRAGRRRAGDPQPRDAPGVSGYGVRRRLSGIGTRHRLPVQLRLRRRDGARADAQRVGQGARHRRARRWAAMCSRP